MSVLEDPMFDSHMDMLKEGMDKNIEADEMRIEADKVRIIRTPSAVIHQISGCYDCDFKDETQRKAGQRARYHSQKTGHNTWVETGTSYEYKEED